jgi:hypothetical protein
MLETVSPVSDFEAPRGPQLMRIAMLLGLVARQRHQPGFGLRRDDRFFARPWSILYGRSRIRPVNLPICAKDSVRYPCRCFVRGNVAVRGTT